MVVAHDSDTLMTFIIPALPLFHGIINHFGQHSISPAELFRVNELTYPTTATPVEAVSDTKSLSSVARRPDSTIIGEFHRKLKECSMRSVRQHRYVRTKSLTQWLLSEKSFGTSCLDLLLDFAYSQYIMVPLEPEHVSNGGGASLLVFCILLELGRGDLIDKFRRQGLTDRLIPFEHTRLESAIEKMRLPDADSLVHDIFELQWAYCPMIFELNMSRELSPFTVIPIHQMERINVKGGVAEVWQITVLEDFVDEKLQKVATSSRFKTGDDKLGNVSNSFSTQSLFCTKDSLTQRCQRFQFAIKCFSSGGHDLFRSELEAFNAFRGINGMVRYFGDWSASESSPWKVANNHLSQSSLDHQERTLTHNLLLEYGELDLDEYFASKQPPVLSKDILLFWKKLFELARAVADIHAFRKDRAGLKEEFFGYVVGIDTQCFFLTY